MLAACDYFILFELRVYWFNTECSLRIDTCNVLFSFAKSIFNSNSHLSLKITLHYFCFIHHPPASDGPFALRKVGAGLYGVLKSEFQTHEVEIVPNF